MTERGYIVHLNNKKTPSSIGNKASNLIELNKLKVDVPEAFVCTWDAYDQFLKKDESILGELRREIESKIDINKAYAVRSSANIEDSIDRSFAGQFTTILNVQGVEQLLQSIKSIWETTRSPSVQTYLDRFNMVEEQLSMAVIIQEMVHSVASGVALSRNPVTGANEIIIEAVHGLGESLVQNGVTPFRWINKAGNWSYKSDVKEIPEHILETIASQTRMISHEVNSPVDLEWAWDGDKVYWLQVREITALNHHNMYSYQISKEMLPGLIKPLVWSINIPMKSKVFVQFLDEMLGETGINPDVLVRSFYYHVYFNMGVIGQAFVKLGLPADSVEMMSGHTSMNKIKMKPTLQMMKSVPNFIEFAHNQWKFPKRIFNRKSFLDSQISSLKQQDYKAMDIPELLAAIDKLYPLVQELTYYNILCPILGVMHKRMFDKELIRLGVEPSLFDINEGIKELEDFNPDFHLHRIHSIFNNFEPTIKEKIRKTTYYEFLELDNIDSFKREVINFIDHFGYLSDNGNDFSTIPWRENPDIVLKLIINSEPEIEEVRQKVLYKDLKPNPIRHVMVRLLYKRVRDFNFLREYLSYCYTYTLGFFRNYYLAIGNYLTNQNMINNPSDIFFLADNDIRQIVQGNLPEYNIQERIEKHKEDIEKFRNITLPSIIYGEETPPIIDNFSEKLSGLSTSIGHHTGPVRVVRGIQDFEKVQKGDVLVIPYSDVGWTPLFARAGAVVAESGGLLSHSSIIAREYGIPAVVSVNGAMNLTDDMTVTVDAHQGVVIIN
jgi:phosphoenolpyruvate synthase/pyruvate phosphate dikinase